MKFRSICLAAALALPLVAGAQGSPAASATSSPAKKELVAKVVRLQQPAIDNLARVLAEQPALQMLQQAAAVLQNRVPADQREAVARDIQAEAKKYVDEAVPVVRDRALKAGPTLLQNMFEERFTEDELKQLVAWLESPVSRKFGQFAGDLQKALGEKIVADAKPAIEPKLRALEQAVSKRLQAAATPAGAASAPK